MLQADDVSFEASLAMIVRYGDGDRPPGSFQELLKQYMDDSGMSVEELAFRSKVSERTIGTLRNKVDYQPQLNTIVSLCVGLGLNPSESYKLIALSGYNLTDGKLHRVYKFILDKSNGASIEECNRFLERAKLPPL